jgi:MOSC domain-containing protein YiiM
MQGSIVGLFAALQGGVPKPSVQLLNILEHGCVGDKQNDTKHHGGPNRAVCLFSSEVVNRLHNEGHPIYPGSVGENILLQEIPWDVVSIGTQFHFNQVILEITSDAPPCRTIKDSFLNEEFKCISAKLNPHSTRWYAKVIQSGEVVTGEHVVLN